MRLKALQTRPPTRCAWALLARPHHRARWLHNVLGRCKRAHHSTSLHTPPPPLLPAWRSAGTTLILALALQIVAKDSHKRERVDEGGGHQAEEGEPEGKEDAMLGWHALG